MFNSTLHQTIINILFNIVLPTATFARGLRCLKNGLLNVHRYVSATIFETPCPQSNVLVNNAGKDEEIDDLLVEYDNLIHQLNKIMKTLGAE